MKKENEQKVKINLRNANHIVHQKIALMQMRQAVLLCYLQILRQFLINYASSGIRRTCAYDANNQPLGTTGMNRIKFTKDSCPPLCGIIRLANSSALHFRNWSLIINIPGAGSVAYNQYQWTRPQSVTLPDGGTSQYAYDELMRTKAITKKDYAANPQMNYAYTYDKMDNIKTRNTQAGNYAYNYDNLYRLNEVKKDTAQTEAYTYDQVGNRTTSKATTGDWTYNSNNELLSTPLSSSGSTGGSSYVYDANGNTIQKNDNGNIRNYVYNTDNRLIEVQDAANNTIAKYTYDPFGRRIKKQTGVNGQPIPSPLAGEGQGEGVITTYYLYSDEGLIGEYDSTGAEIKTYGYEPDSTWSTNPIFMKQGANYYFYHNDHLGTPQKMTNLSGAIVWSATYDAFGKAAVDAASTITNNLRFPGQYFDAETGWHYNWNRYYDSNTGRYVTEDPIGFGVSGDHLYIYVNNNAVNSIDPLGLWNETIHTKLTNKVLGRLNCNKAAIKIVAANVGVDKDPLTNEPDNAFWHAMSNGKRKPPNKSIDIKRYAQRVEAGRTSCVEKVIGEATHALQDSFAPAHKGFQPWYGSKWELRKHTSDAFESVDSAAAEEATFELLKDLYKRCPCLCK